jgi:hypothetical protein
LRIIAKIVAIVIIKIHNNKQIKLLTNLLSMSKSLSLTTLLSIIVLFPVHGNDDLSQTSTTSETQIHVLGETVYQSNRYVETLDSSTFYNLPVGLIGGSQKDPSYAILINKAVIKPEGAYFNAYMSLTNPFDGTKLAFQAENVPFSFKGGLRGDLRLELVTKAKFTICKDVDLFILPGSYVEWDCNGFKMLKIKGSVEFASSTFLPAKEDGQLKKEGSKLKTFIEIDVKDLNDIAFNISIDPFQIKGLNDITFSIKNLALDYSDFMNPSSIKFPANYLTTYSPENKNLWRGIYIGDAKIILGPKFRNKKKEVPSAFEAKDLIIDDNGLTGILSVDSLLAIDEGDLGGWEFSIAKLSVKLLAGRLTEASFNGEVHIPAMKEGSNLGYGATIGCDGKYSFIVSAADTLTMPLFGAAKLQLYKNSSVTINVVDDQFVPVANLTGNISFNAQFSKGNDKNNLKLAKVEFQEMRFSTVEPVFDIKYFAVAASKQGGFANFPITIDKIAFVINQDKAKLSIGLVINLMNSSDEGFGGATTLALVAERKGYKFEYKGIEIEMIKIDIEKGSAFAIHGKIMFARDDIVYGNGFRGSLKARFGKNIEIEAIALFGKVHGYRYFFVDAMFSMKPGIQAGPITFYGFGGGLYSHMKQQPGVIDPESFGASRSGIVYAPNDSISIGIMAEVKFGIINEKLVDADVKFEIVFNSHGGLNFIGFYGGAKCIVPGLEASEDNVKKNAQAIACNGKLAFDPTGAPIAVTVSMEMDFEHDVFHAELEAFLNVAGVLTGIGPQGSCGKCVMHIEKTKWYMHLGTPANPLGLKILSVIQLSGYFMAGFDIPTELPLNPTVAAILKITPEQACANRTGDDLSTGKGVAFGSCFSISTGDLSFLCFYGKFELGMGYDMLMVSLGKDVRCQGHNPPVGINGWYAKGQAFAYMEGQIGIVVKVFKKNRKFEILDIGAAALLRAEGPNPMYIEGQAGGYFRLLGGMVKGECKFKVTAGEKCLFVKDSPTAPQSAVQELNLIASVTPQQDAKDVDIFNVPQAVFNVPVNKTMNISEEGGAVRRFRANLEKCELKKGNDLVPGSSSWNADQSVLAYQPNNILYPKANYHFEVEVSFDEWKDNQWVTVTDSGVKTIEKKSCDFVTGDLPKEIPMNSIAYCYPVMRQYNFYPKEYPTGYIAFNMGLAPYFNMGREWKQKARFNPVNGGASVMSDMTYDDATRTVSFNIPPTLNGNTIYKLELTNIPVGGSVDKNVTQTTTNVALENDSNTMQVTTKEATGTISRAEEIVFLSYGFRASKYKTMNEKLSFSSLQVDMLYDISPYVYHLQSTITGSEMFDKFEIYGTDNTPPLLRRTAVLENTPWYKQAVAPVIYKDYPLLGQANITWRDTSKVGVPPIGDIKIWQVNFDHILSDDELETGVATAVTDMAHFMYGLPYNWSKDYYDIRMKLANLYPSMTTTDPHVNAILNKVIWPVVDQGAYPVKFEYVLPGINKVTSTKIFTMNNPFHLVQPSL